MRKGSNSDRSLSLNNTTKKSTASLELLKTNKSWVVTLKSIRPKSDKTVFSGQFGGVVRSTRIFLGQNTSLSDRSLRLFHFFVISLIFSIFGAFGWLNHR
jgi:hypothetical protein